MIRDAIEKDAEEICSIYNYYIRNSVATFEESEITACSVAERINNINNSGHSWLVATEENKVVGYAYSSKWNDRVAYKNTAEVSVYLSHTSVKNGVGAKLYTVLFSRLRDKNTHVVIGGITLPNKASVALHEKFDMVQVAHFKEVGYKFGQWLDVGYWQVKLNA